MTKQIKARWTNVLNSGNRALEVVLDAIAHTQEHGDTSLLAWMIDGANKDNKGTYAKRLRLIVGKVYPEAKIRTPKDKPVSITRGDKYDPKVVEALTALHAEGYSLIGDKFLDVFGITKAEETVEEKMAKRIKADAKFILDNDEVSLEKYITDLRATYAQQAALKLAKAA